MYRIQCIRSSISLIIYNRGRLGQVWDNLQMQPVPLPLWRRGWTDSLGWVLHCLVGWLLAGAGLHIPLDTSPVKTKALSLVSCHFYQYLWIHSTLFILWYKNYSQTCNKHMLFDFCKFERALILIYALQILKDYQLCFDGYRKISKFFDILCQIEKRTERINNAFDLQSSEA